MLKSLIGGSAILVAHLLLGPILTPLSGGVEGHGVCVKNKTKGWCGGTGCLKYFYYAKTTSTEGNKNVTAGTSTNACVGGTICSETAYFPAITGCTTTG